MKTKIMGLAIALAVTLGMAAFAAGGGIAAFAADPVKSLRGVDANQADGPPDLHRVVEGTRLDRAYRQQPPLVPHATDKYEIDLKVNQCLRCHEWPYSDQEKAPKISDFHYIDRDGVRHDKVNGNRYFCKQCHVPQQDAKPLVENSFHAADVNR